MEQRWQYDSHRVESETLVVRFRDAEGSFQVFNIPLPEARALISQVTATSRTPARVVPQPCPNCGSEARMIRGDNAPVCLRCNHKLD
jgi:NADH pyrophosphatase NudC (nudix superfamily)